MKLVTLNTFFLTNFFDANHKTDSAYFYLKLKHRLSDSIESKGRVKAMQGLTINEEIRQIELAEKLEKEKEERAEQMQLILIGLFIPELFFITVILTQIKIHIRLIRFLGIISLLFFFEYLTLLLHPIIIEIAHHKPFWEILILVLLAAVIIPIHHKVEHFVIERLLHRAQTTREKKKSSGITNQAINESADSNETMDDDSDE